MQKEMLHKYIKEQFKRSLYLYDPLEMYDYAFNSYIGFGECFEIQKVIKENVSKDIFNFKIDNCDFIDTINIVSIIIKDEELSSCDDKSEFVTLENKILTIRFTLYDWKYEKYYLIYKLLRDTLYIAYYYHLKETDPNHMFVQFVEFLSRVDLYKPGKERYISLEEYIDSLEETEHHKPIDENLFIECLDRKSELESNERHFYFYLD